MSSVCSVKPLGRVGFSVVSMGLMLLTGLANAKAQDTGAGQKVLQQKCAICHTVQPGVNRVGPSLYGVVGRKAGTGPGYSYSKAMASSGLTWTPQDLDTYLAKPQAVVAGTKMAFVGLPDQKQRQDLIAYLETLHD